MNDDRIAGWPGWRGDATIAQGWAADEPGMTTVISLPAREVLDLHAALRDRWRYPTDKHLGYLDGFMDRVRKMAYADGGEREVKKAFGSLFWPAATEKQFSDIISSQLFRAQTYQVSSDMMDAVTGTYRASASKLVHLEEHELPSEAGFVWFDKAVAVHDLSGKVVLHRAISWSTQVIRYTDGEQMGVRMTAWYYADDRDSYWDDSLAEVYAGLGRLILSHSQLLPFGTRVGGFQGGESTVDDFAAWVHTLWMFMDAKIVTSAKPPIERHFRKRALRSLQHDDVRVVTLRRAHPLGDGTGEVVHGNVDWSCRWIVQGHWRHVGAVVDDSHGAHHATPDQTRTHCTACQGKITWIRPYLKGPDDKPLHSADKLFRLSR